MDQALALARAQLGRTAPNPAVGCVLVRAGAVIGGGATADGGRPHAERLALDMAGEAARGAEAFVTLEPCAHHGQTPPCAEALIAADIARVHIACLDPDPRVSGRGIALLEAAGIEIATGLREQAALDLNAGFFKRLRTGLPLVAIDPDPLSYDASPQLDLNRDLAAQLKSLGDQGATRLHFAPGGALARALSEAGLVDRVVDPDPKHSPIR